MADDALARVHFFDHQVLRLQDFVDEQAYHLGAHRRHNTSHHVWGIVSGLDLVLDREDGALYVEPGVAADAYGRDLVLENRLAVGREVFAERDSDVLDVFLNYGRRGTDQAAEGWAGCDAHGDGSFYRWLERPFLTFELPDVAPVDRRRPGQAEPDHVDSPATRVLPDDPGRRWPVFLGQVTLNRADEAVPYTVDQAGRPYAGLVGQAVYSPSGRAAVQIGAERPDDRNRFAVFVPEAETAGQTRPRQPIQPRLAIDEGGDHTIRGDVTLHGDLTVAGHAVEFQPGPERAREDRPWRVYHVERRPDAGVAEHQLRIEMASASSGQPAGRNQVVIGAWAKPPDGGPEGFRPCLTVADDCSVTVHGNLVLPRPPTVGKNAEVDAGLGPAARSLALSSFLSGVTGSSALVRTPSQATGSSISVLHEALTAALAPENAVRAAATAIAADRDLVEPFAALLHASGAEVAAQLRTRLAELAGEQTEPPAEGGGSAGGGESAGGGGGGDDPAETEGGPT